MDGTLPLVCQRCLDRYDWRFELTFECVVVGDDREETDGEEAVVCPGGRIALEPMIEEELLLAVPNSPVHPHGSCDAPPFRSANEPVSSPERHPFAALGALRSGRRREQSN